MTDEIEQIQVDETQDQRKTEIKKKRGLKFYLKVLFTFFLLIVLSLSIAVYYVYYRLSHDSGLEKVIMAKVSNAVKMPVEFKKIEMSFPSFNIKQAHIATDTSSLSANIRIDKISVTPDFMEIISGNLVISNFSISSSTAIVNIKKKPMIRASKQISSQDKKIDLSGISFPFKSINFKNLKLFVSDSNTGEKYNIELPKASLSEAFVGGGYPFDFSLKAKNIAELDGKGKLHWPSSVDMDINLRNVNAKKFEDKIPAQYKRLIQYSANSSLAASLNYKLNGKLKIKNMGIIIGSILKAEGQAEIASFSPVTANLSLKINEVKTDDIMKIARQFIPKTLPASVSGGSFHGDLKINIDKSALKDINLNLFPKNINIKASQFSNSIALKKADVHYDGKALQVNNLEAKGFDSTISLAKTDIAFAPMKVDAVISANANIGTIWKIANKYLPKTKLAISPTGKASFVGSFNYSDAIPHITGILKTNSLKVDELQNHVSVKVKNCNVKANKLSPKSGDIQIKSFDIEGLGAGLKIRGNIKNDKNIALALTAKGGLDLKQFAAIAYSIFKLKLGKNQFLGKINLDAGINGTIADLKPYGNFKFSNLKISLPNKGLLITNLSATAKAEKNSLKLSKATADFMNGKLSATGSLTDFKKPSISLNGNLTGADLTSVRAFIKTNFPEMPDEIKFSGKTDLAINISGAVSAPKVKGTATLKNASFFHPAMLRPAEHINGPVSFNNYGFGTKGLKLTWGTSAATVKGNLKDWTKFILNFDYTVNPIDLDDIGDYFLKSSGFKLIGKGSGSGKIYGPVAQVVVKGNANVPRGNVKMPMSDGKGYYQFPFEKLSAPFKYYSSILAIDKATASIFRGKITASSKFYLAKEPIAFGYNILAKDIKSEDFLALNMKAANIIKGGINGKFVGVGNVSGINTLNGNLSFGMLKGTYSAPKSARGILNKIGLSRLASGTINNMGADGKLKNGRVYTKNLVAKNKNGKMNYDGSMGLDTTLDGKANLVLPKEICKKTDVLKQLIGSQNELTIPMKIKGTLTSPKIDAPLDKMISSVAKKSITKAIKNGLQKEIGKIFGKKKTENASGTTSIANQPKKIIDTKKIQKKVNNLGKNLGKSLKKLFKF